MIFAYFSEIIGNIINIIDEIMEQVRMDMSPDIERGRIDL